MVRFRVEGSQGSLKIYVLVHVTFRCDCVRLEVQISLRFQGSPGAEFTAIR
jgi:hypothetical protein